MKERFIENNIEFILAEDSMYYPKLHLSEDIKTCPISLYDSSLITLQIIICFI